MTRKDFELIARALRAAQQWHHDDPGFDKGTAHTVTETVADFLAAAHERFDHERFTHAANEPREEVAR